MNEPTSTQPAPNRRRRLPGVGQLLLAGAVLGLAVLIVWFWRTWTQPWFPPTDTPVASQEIRIQSGMTLAAVTDSLTSRGLLRHPQLFRVVARLSGRDRLLQAGRYALYPGLSPRDLLSLLVEGRTIPVMVTLPEGITAPEAADLVATALDFQAARFLSAADSLVQFNLVEAGWLGVPARAAQYDSILQVHSAQLPRQLHWAEGYLAPDTYHFAEGVSARSAASVVVKLGLARVDSCYRDQSTVLAELDLNPHQLVTLASLIEAEARQNEERVLIAAVYVNRLRKGWRLEADPCAAFLLNKKGQRLLYRDLEIESPYNTYRRAGLPPGPINSPGLASIAAAAQPDTSCDALFFVADGEGGHVFSRTRREHEKAVREYRQRRRAASH